MTRKKKSTSAAATLTNKFGVLSMDVDDTAAAAAEIISEFTPSLPLPLPAPAPNPGFEGRFISDYNLLSSLQNIRPEHFQVADQLLPTSVIHPSFYEETGFILHIVNQNSSSAAPVIGVVRFPTAEPHLIPDFLDRHYATVREYAANYLKLHIRRCNLLVGCQEDTDPEDFALTFSLATPSPIAKLFPTAFGRSEVPIHYCYAPFLVQTLPLWVNKDGTLNAAVVINAHVHLGEFHKRGTSLINGKLRKRPRAPPKWQNEPPPAATTAMPPPTERPPPMTRERSASRNRSYAKKTRADYQRERDATQTPPFTPQRPPPAAQVTSSAAVVASGGTATGTAAGAQSAQTPRTTGRNAWTTRRTMPPVPRD
jgi:hypothetical protein